MGLIDLKTDLTSLPYGKDRPGGGSSKSPYITKDIPGRNKSFLDQIEEERTGKYGSSVSNDFGFRTALFNTGAPFEDVERLAKLYADKGTGLVFEAKQLILASLTEPTAVWNPLAVTLQNALPNVLGFGHIPSFINPDIKNFFSQPFPGPTDFRSVGGTNALKPGDADVYQLGNPAEGTNPFFKLKIPFTDRKLGTSIVRSRKHYNVVYDRKDPNNLSVNDETLPKDITALAKTADQISIKPLYKSTTEDETLPKDFIKFKIRVVDNDDPTKSIFIHFRAFLESFSDSFSASWDEQRFVGRGDAFYRYNGFSRNNALSFKIAVQSRQEQKNLYEKLTYLASLTAPDYSPQGFMRGTLIYLTIGDYLVDVPGVIGGMNLTIDPSSPWEIAKLNNGDDDTGIAQLPHIIGVDSFEFKPIHNFVPQRGSRFIGYDNYDDNVKQTDLISIEELGATIQEPSTAFNLGAIFDLPPSADASSLPVDPSSLA